jgi:hypothetical protein
MQLIGTTQGLKMERTTVTATLLKEHFDALKELFADAEVDSCFEGSVELVIATFYNAALGDLEFEGEFLAAHLPFDLDWASTMDYHAGFNSFRVLANGETKLLDAQDASQYNKISLPEIEAAISNNELESFLDKKRTEFFVMEWSEQSCIMDARAEAAEELLKKELADLKVLVEFFVSAKRIEPDKIADTQEDHVKWLMDHGYMSNALKTLHTTQSKYLS